MPNWVYNTVSIDGPKKVVEAFVASKITGEDSKFDFAKIIVPPADKAEEYNAVAMFGTPAMTDPYNWYNWNIDHWGTKWNACEVWVTSEDCGDGQMHFEAHFQTAWDLPRGVMHRLAYMCEVYDLTLTWYGEEEQGWSEEWSNLEGEFLCVEELDIPTSHADYVSRDRSCTCEYGLGSEWRFDDCPQLDRASLIG